MDKFAIFKLKSCKLGSEIDNKALVQCFSYVSATAPITLGLPWPSSPLYHLVSPSVTIKLNIYVYRLFIFSHSISSREINIYLNFLKMWPIVTTKLIKLCYGSTANTCLINWNNNFKIAKTHTWWVKALRTPSSLRANETKSSQIAFSPKYCWVCKASGTDNEAAETPAWVCTSQLKRQEGVSAGKSMKILRRGYSLTRIFSDEVAAEAFLPLHHRTLLVLLLLHLLPSKHRHRHRRLVLRRAVLELVGNVTKNISTAGCYVTSRGSLRSLRATSS